MNMKFYDTCSLLQAGENLFNSNEKFCVSSISFKELERIKTASNKDADVKYSARLLLHLFEQYPNAYEVIVHNKSFEKDIEQYDFDITDDTKILADAINSQAVVFVTNDLSLKSIAKTILGENLVESLPEETDNYKGYNEIYADNDQLEDFYKNTTINHFDLKIGEYLILRNADNDVIDVRAWTGNDHRFLSHSNFNSKWFGKVKPFDVYQKLLFDSLSENKITMVKGPAGSGKTQCSLAFLMSQIEHGNLDKIIVFCNTVATANAAKLGFYPGTRLEKLLDSQIGNVLSSKFGGREGVESLINQEKLVLLPMSDIRGYDTTGMKAGIYISEAQNLDRTLMKLALQRVGEDCVCIIDGDIRSQVDDIHFEGANNGMRRASKIYRGHDIYGEVELQKIYRSEIGRIAESM